MATKSKTTTSKVDKKRMVCSGGCSKTPKALNNFYQSTREEYEEYYGYCTTCKACLRKSTIDPNLNTVTMDSIKDALRKIDRPLIESVFMEVKNNPETTNVTFLGRYISLINLKPKYKECKYSDTVDIQIEQEKILNSKVEDAKKLDVTDDMIMFWGKGLTSEDYFDLQARFDRFISSEEDPYNLDYKKELDYKKLVIWEFQLSKIQYDLDKIKESSQLQKNIADLSNDLGIKAIQKKEDNSNKGAYDLFIKKIETTKPIFNFERDLGNKDEMRELLELYFYGYLMDVNNKKTEFTEALYKDIENYTPNINDIYNSDDDEEDGD